MRLELWILFIVVGLMVNSYYDNKFVKMVYSYKKYIKIGFIGICGLVIYYVLKYNPKNMRNLISSASTYIRYMPLDKNSKDIITPLFDMTASGFVENFNTEFNGLSNEIIPNSQGETKDGIIKRSVSETKKKYVASKNGWKCARCGNMLKHTYEVDHITALKDGGDNSVDNLRALCTDCHKSKTLETFLR